jgi:long-chain fatty acid transport protein
MVRPRLVNHVRSAWRVALAVLSMMLAPAARASDTHYQDLLLGQRAMGMGGAFVSLADDPSSSFYNPAGLALMGRTSAGASLGIYGIERRAVDRGFAGPLDAVDLRHTAFPIIATTFAVATRFGRGASPRNAIGFSLFLPFSDSQSLSRLVQRGGEAGVYQVGENDRTLWVGPSYARRFGSGLSMGFSMFYESRSFSRTSEFSNFLLTPRGGQSCAGTPLACSLATSIDATTGGLFLRVGALWKIDAEWRLGMAFSTPTLHLHGSADVSSRRLVASPGGVDFVVVGESGVPAYTRRPFEIRFGAAYEESEAFTWSIDVSLHGPLVYRRFDTSAMLVDPLLVREVRREAVVNVNLGAEYFPTHYLPLRFGLFTNWSSAPEIPDRTREPYLARVHRFGASVSVGYRGDGYGIDFGVSAQFGSGVAQAFDPDDQTILRRAGVNHTLIYFFVSGIGTAIARNLNRLLRKFE